MKKHKFSGFFKGDSPLKKKIKDKLNAPNHTPKTMSHDCSTLIWREDAQGNLYCPHPEHENTMRTPKIVRLPDEKGQGFAILQDGGNLVYFPQEMIDFCNDWLGGFNKVTNALKAHEDLVKACEEIKHFLSLIPSTAVNANGRELEKHEERMQQVKYLKQVVKEALAKAGVKP